MKCGRCGRENPSGAKRCVHCNAQFVYKAVNMPNRPQQGRPMQQRPVQRVNGQMQQRPVQRVNNGRPVQGNIQRKQPAPARKKGGMWARLTTGEKSIFISIVSLVLVFAMLAGIYTYQSCDSGRGGFSGGGGGGGGYTPANSDGTYNVTFNYNYDNLEKVVVQVKAGECVVPPAIKEREDFVFAGWFDENDVAFGTTDPSHLFDFTQPVNTHRNLTAYWIDIKDTTDTDGDKLTDNVELYYTTNKENKDTDGDGLNDYIELAVLNLDPKKVDSDGNGVADGNEDTDGDGLTNIDEINRGTDPGANDTDGDQLSDGDEVNKYKTNPLKADTDGDGANDGDEIELGTDPLTKQTSFKVKVTADSTGDTVTPSVEMDVTGDQVGTLHVEKREDEYLFPASMPGYIGGAYDFSIKGAVKKATISFKFTKKATDPVIYYFNEAECTLEPLKTTVSGDTASAVVTHFSTYILIDRKIYEEAFEWQDTWVMDSAYDSVEIVLVIDDSGSMDSNDPNDERLSVAKTLIDNLPEDSKIGVVRFESGTEILTSSLITDKNQAKGFLTTDKFRSSGGTRMYTAINDAFPLFESTKDTTLRMMVVLSDGATTDKSAHDSTISTANSKKVKVFTVGLGKESSYFNEYLKPLAEKTAGKFYYATDAAQLADIYKDISKGIDLSMDADEDGLPDYYEENLVLFNGEKAKCDKNKKDTDGDGLEDGEEVEIPPLDKCEKKVVDGKTYVKIKGKVKSDPTKPDTDFDGYIDSKDKKPMVWDVGDRDLLMASALSYESKDALNAKKIEKDNSNTYGYGSCEELLEHWDLVAYSDEVTVDLNMQFCAITLKNKNNIIIAYRGTDQMFGEMVLGNGVGYGILNRHPEESMARKYARRMAEAYPDCNIYITGHSLGGYLAFIGTLELIDEGHSKSLKKVRTFNGIGLCFNVCIGIFGKAQALLKLEDFWNGKYGNENNIMSYRIEGDVVSGMGYHLEIESLPPIDEAKAKHVSGQKGKFWDNAKESALKHFIGALSSEYVMKYYKEYNCSSMFGEYIPLTHELGSFFKHITQGTRGVKK